LALVHGFCCSFFFHRQGIEDVSSSLAIRTLQISGVNQIEIKNVGTAPIEIKDITINNRPECSISTLNNVITMTNEQNHQAWLKKIYCTPNGRSKMRQVGNELDQITIAPLFWMLANVCPAMIKDQTIGWEINDRFVLEVGEAEVKPVICGDAIRISIITNHGTAEYHTNR
jgi:hypothetical protein